MSASTLVPEIAPTQPDVDASSADDDLRTDPEVHIAGIVVHVRPEMVDTIRKQLPMIPNAQLHAATEDGRMIVTLEAESSRRTVDQMDAIRALPGVINVALVYQHAEPQSALDEEIEP